MSGDGGEGILVSQITAVRWQNRHHDDAFYVKLTSLMPRDVQIPFRKSGISILVCTHAQISVSVSGKKNFKTTTVSLIIMAL